MSYFNRSMNTPTAVQHLLNLDMQSEWQDWKWQQRNAKRTFAEVSKQFPQLPQETVSQHFASRKVRVTPYYLRLIERYGSSDTLMDNPLFRQVVSFRENELVQGYDGSSENRDPDREMKTPICQHKYDNCVILRLTNSGKGYCQFCFEGLRTLKIAGDKKTCDSSAWQDTHDYLKDGDDVEEVIFNGGNPLMLSDCKSAKYLRDLRDKNDDHETLSDLFMRPHRIGVVPYYLYHNMPYSAGYSQFGSSDRNAIKLMQDIKRHKSNLAVPEYVCLHPTGKYTVPSHEEDDYPCFAKTANGEELYQFTGWKGEKQHWLESRL